MNFVTRQDVRIVKQAPKNINLSYEELDQKCINIMAGHGHIAEGMDFWGFLEKNRWSLATVISDKTKIINNSFDAVHGFICHNYLCKKCEGIFRVPFEVKECMFCGNKDMEKERRRIRIGDTHGRKGVKDGVDPDLYNMAVKDIQEHGTEQTGPEYEPDWKYLEDNI